MSVFLFGKFIWKLPGILAFSYWNLFVFWSKQSLDFEEVKNFSLNILLIWIVVSNNVDYDHKNSEVF